MSKKGNFNIQDKYDDTEDLDIKEIAYYKDNIGQYIMLLLLITSFGIGLTFITSYKNYTNKKKLNESYSEVVEITNDKGSILITSNALIDKTITNDNFSESKPQYVVENLDSISLSANKDQKKSVKLKYDVKYVIDENTFKHHVIESEASDLLVRFSYSYDLEEWEDVKNVISLTESSLNPLMGNSFDIAGIVDTLNVVTDKELEAKPGDTEVIYWRSETIFKYNHIKDFSGKINANFKIEYKGID